MPSILAVLDAHHISYDDVEALRVLAGSPSANTVRRAENTLKRRGWRCTAYGWEHGFHHGQHGSLYGQEPMTIHEACRFERDRVLT